MSSPSTRPDGDSGGLRGRQEVLAMLDDVLSESHRKVESGRVYDPEAERVRQGWIRAFAYAAGQYRQLKRDEELSSFDERLSELERARGIDAGDSGTEREDERA